MNSQGIEKIFDDAAISPITAAISKLDGQAETRKAIATRAIRG